MKPFTKIPALLLLVGAATIQAVDFRAAGTAPDCLPDLRGSVRPLSVLDASATPSASAGGDSAGAAISADGRFVAFSSNAGNLVGNDTKAFNLDGFNDVFVKNLATGTISLVSGNSSGSGGNDDSWGPALSGDGRWIAFQSRASDLVANDGNGLADVFVWDANTKITSLVSVNAQGTSGNGESGNASISEDGRWVVFESAASDLAAGDTNVQSDIFIRDLRNGTTALVSSNATGDGAGDAASEAPAMTPDARRVAYLSAALNMGGPTVTNTGHLFVRDTAQGATYWASANLVAQLDAAGVTNSAQYRCFNPALSDDGRWVAFKAAVRGSSKSAFIFRHDLELGETLLVATNAAPNISGVAEASGPILSADGQVLAYDGIDNLVHIWKNGGASDTVASTQADGTPLTLGRAHTPMLSRDGRTLAFLSDSPQIVPEAANLVFQIYSRDLETGQTRLASADETGKPLGESDCGAPTLSADGSKILFQTRQPVVADDTNEAYDVYLRDLVKNATALVSARSPGLPDRSGRGPSFVGFEAASADGRWLAFTTAADRLVPADTNGFWDVIVRDLASGASLLASANTNGAAANGFSRSPAFSADGKKVAFVSSATDLAEGDTNKVEDVFVRDLPSGVTALASVKATGAGSASLASGSPVLSPDGRWVAFASKAKDLVTDDTDTSEDLFVRDLQLGQTVRLTNSLSKTTSSRTVTPLKIGATANVYYTYLVPTTAATTLFVSDIASGASWNIGPVGSRPFVTGNGRYAAVRSATAPDYLVTVFDFQAKANIATGVPLSTGILLKEQNRVGASVSEDGNRVAFTSALRLETNRDGNGTNDVYLFDFQSGQTQLASLNRDGTGSGNGPSGDPVLSPDGRWLAFRSRATDLTATPVSGENLYLRDLVAGSTRLVAVLASGASAHTSPVWFAGDGLSAFFGGALADDPRRTDHGQESAFSFAVAPECLSDSDKDGMDDAWELAQFGNLSHDGGQDSDGDGLTDLQEFLTGTDPLKADSVFALYLVARDADGKTRLRWPALAGKTYRIEYKTDLNDPAWIPLPQEVQAQTSEGAFTDDTGGGERRFYRVFLKP